MRLDSIPIKSDKVSLGEYLNSVYADTESILSLIEKLTKRLEPILQSRDIAGTAKIKEDKKDSDLVESVKNIQDRLFYIRTNLEMLEDCVQV